MLKTQDHRKIPVVAAVLAGLIAVALPVWIALELAAQQAEEAEFAHLDSLAREVLRRSEETRAQINSAAAALRDSGLPICSEAQLVQMRELDVRSTYLQAVGQIQGTRLMCSSLGRHGDGIELGAAPVRPSGIRSRIGLSLPFVPGQLVNVYERDGIASIVNPALVMDIVGPDDVVSLAVVAFRPTQVVRARGIVKPEWIERAQNSAAFSDGEYLVVVKLSKHRYVASLAAAPIASVHNRMMKMAKILVPIGILSGALLAGVALVLTRQFLSMKSALKAALRRREFFLVYQPVVDLVTGQCVGAEALIRWRRRDGTLVRPDVFIPVAEDSGFVHEITIHVMEMVARDAASLLKNHPHLHISINLSSVDLQLDDTPHLLQRLIAQMRVKPHNILVEATERGFMQADRARAVLNEIKRLELQVAIDDFGTGYSSLSYLETFSLDFLKIDKSFVDTMGRDAATSQVAPHIIEMAKSLRLKMIAEGVETADQVKFLRERGVQFAQGWFFCKPGSIQDLEAFVRSSKIIASPVDQLAA